MNRAVFLDRDGVINQVVLREGRPYPPASPEDLQFLPGVATAVQELRQAGFKIVVVTNQPDVATGAQTSQLVEAIHQKIRTTLQIDEFRVCYHVDQDGCSCRKPKPGMLFEAAADLSIDLDQSFMVGDRWRDIAAGTAAGCRTIFIDHRYAERPPEKPDAVVDSLWEASQLILSDQVFRGTNA